jgi:hypothetical protein
MQASSTDLKHVRAPAKSEERQETLHFFQVAFHRTSTHFFIEKNNKNCSICSAQSHHWTGMVGHQ